MLVQAAEESYQKGLRAIEAGKGWEATAYFEAAIELERRFGEATPQARYLSHYGLCLSTVMQRRKEAVRFCREAATIEQYNPDLKCNLGRVFLAAGRRKDAHRALMEGLEIQSDHRGILSTLQEMGVRRPPALPFLSRSNPINVLLGRLRSNGT